MPKELEAKIIEIIPRTSNVKSFRLDTGEEIDYKAGQFLCASLRDERDCKRYLSISSSPTEKGYIEFTKKITQSDFSSALNNFKTGDSLIVKYPMGNFILRDEEASNIAFLSGGIGITPIRSICKYVVDKRLDKRIVLLYGNRSINDIVFKDDFEIMQKEYPGLKVTHVLCEPAVGFECIPGLINAGVIKEQIPDYSQRKFYLCGPPGMIDAMQKTLIDELFLARENIITEKFIGY
ncbi:MAG: FAD-binding oxidoreductase [Candidatus Omnitrophica bacterium]|nr:FAD-binding oxidoreductase [Candidatus Omnitrophota bacterium]MDD5552266.1 FAD-binding oxidoreductase [Candidatus Omnitrophota bacterium]